MQDIINLGFKDITNESPIKFIDKIDVGFDTIYDYSKKYIKKDKNITTVILVAIGNLFVDIEGKCFYSKGYQGFHITNLKEYIGHQLDAILKIIYNKIKQNENN